MRDDARILVIFSPYAHPSRGLGLSPPCGGHSLNKRRKPLVKAQDLSERGLREPTRRCSPWHSSDEDLELEHAAGAALHFRAFFARPVDLAAVAKFGEARAHCRSSEKPRPAEQSEQRVARRSLCGSAMTSPARNCLAVCQSAPLSGRRSNRLPISTSSSNTRQHWLDRSTTCYTLPKWQIAENPFLANEPQAGLSPATN